MFPKLNGSEWRSVKTLQQQKFIIDTGINKFPKQPYFEFRQLCVDFFFNEIKNLKQCSVLTQLR